MGLEFTYLQCIRLEAHNISGDIDQNLCEIVKDLDGKIKNWQVLAPTPQVRILYFEPDDAKPVAMVEGYNKELRELATPKTPKRRGRKAKNV